MSDYPTLQRAISEFRFLTQEETDALSPHERATYDAAVRRQWLTMVREDGLDWDYEPSPVTRLCNGEFNQ